MTASTIVFSVFAGIGLVLSVVPLYWHLKARNVGTCMYMIWTALGCLVSFVNSIVWNGNTVNWAPAWCDFAIRIELAIGVAFPACTLCIIRHLYYIASPTAVRTTKSEKRREMIIDLLITIGIPVLQMGLQFIVAGHRFNIFEDYGCCPTTLDTPLAYVLVWSWPVVIGVISAGYGFFTIRAFMRRRKEFKDLVITNSNLTYSHYWRLVALASIDFCFTIPLGTCVIVLDARINVHQWVPWDEIHWGYSHVSQVPRVVWNQMPLLVVGLEILRWGPVLCAFLFFGFFGFADEAMENYRLLASTIAKCLGRKRIPQNPPPDQPPAANFPTDEVPQIPESVLDLASVRRSSTTDAPESVYPDDALCQV